MQGRGKRGESKQLPGQELDDIRQVRQLTEQNVVFQCPTILLATKDFLAVAVVVVVVEAVVEVDGIRGFFRWPRRVLLPAAKYNVGRPFGQDSTLRSHHTSLSNDNLSSESPSTEIAGRSGTSSMCCNMASH